MKFFSMRDFSKLLDYLRRQEALDILHHVQTASARNGKDDISMDEIDAEIAAYRLEKLSIKTISKTERNDKTCKTD